MKHYRRDRNGRFAPTASHPAPVPSAPARRAHEPESALTVAAAYERFATTRWNPDEDTITRYTASDCWILALATHERTGWPLVAVADGAADRDGQPVDDYATAHTLGWVHLAVMTPDGQVLDVRGQRSPGEVLEEFDQMADDPDNVDLVPVPCTDAWTRLSLTGDEITAAQAVHAGSTADALIAAHRVPGAPCVHH